VPQRHPIEPDAMTSHQLRAKKEQPLCFYTILYKNQHHNTFLTFQSQRECSITISKGHLKQGSMEQNAMIIKSELITRISKKMPATPEKEVALGINHMIEKISDTLSKHNRVEIRGFGGFALRFRRPRLAHNPKSGIQLITEAKYAVHFKPGKEMRERINAQYQTPIHQSSKHEEDEL
jgi:integration host factor subunit beta